MYPKQGPGAVQIFAIAVSMLIEAISTHLTRTIDARTNLSAVERAVRVIACAYKAICTVV